MVREPLEKFTDFKVRYSVDGCCRRNYIVYNTTPVPLERGVIPKNVGDLPTVDNEKINRLG